MGGILNMEDSSRGLDIRLHIQQSSTAKVLSHPTFLSYEITPSPHTQNEVHPPLPYFTDALLGLSAYKLTLYSKDFSHSSEEENVVNQLWQGLEPLYEVYQRSFQRISPLLHSAQKSPSDFEIKLDQGIAEILNNGCTSEGIDFVELSGILDCIDYFETKRHCPLLFDLNLKLPSITLERLHALNSVLYNLRALSAIYYNSNRKESLYETLHLDNVKDYFHAPDLLTNDTLLCHQFLTLKKNGSFREGSSGLETLDKSFKNYLPHSYQLLQSLPESFFSNQTPEQLEQSLYSFQIDWLLGTPAGLLYRIREELNGLREGYDQTFWPELQHTEVEVPISILHVNCTLSAKHIQQLSNETAA